MIKLFKDKDEFFEPGMDKDFNNKELGEFRPAYKREKIEENHASIFNYEVFTSLINSLYKNNYELTDEILKFN